MRRLHARLAAACALAVAMAVLTSGSAFAGGGDHGNSANAPGQQKQEQAQSAPQQQQSQPSSDHGVNSTSEGTKPSSTTAHNTSTHAGDSPDVSKRYGNGKTAAQIAKSRGAGANVEIRGPGNSQPHKVCHNGHWVDVHAVKSYSDTTCAAASTKHEDSKHEDSKHESKPEEHKVTLCHATGSSTNPYVMITVDYHALKEGHTAAKGDIIPPTTINGVTYSGNWDAAGQAIFNNGCKPVAAAQAPVTTTTTQATTTVETTTVATTTQAQLPVTTTVTTPSTVTVTTPVTTTETTTTPQLTQSTGGVLGAATSLTPAKKKAHGGVLGTVTNVAGSTLPFTGFPVWLAVLVAIALILAGIALRRRTLGARL